MPEFARNARLAALAFLLVGSLAAGGYAIDHAGWFAESRPCGWRGAGSSPGGDAG